MHEEQFDEFEEATYSSIHPHPQTTAHSMGQLNDHLQAANLKQEVQPSETNQHFSTLASNPAQSINLDFQSAYKSESVSPQLGKISSAHEITEAPLMFDFIKIHSLKEESNHSPQHQFFNLSLQPQNETTNLHFFPQQQPKIQPTQQPSNVPTANTDFLLDFSSQDSNIYANPSIMNFSTPLVNEAKVELFNWESINTNQSTNLQAPPVLPTSANESLLYQMSENVNGKIQEMNQVSSLENKNESGLPISTQAQSQEIEFVSQVKQQTSEDNHYAFEVANKQPLLVENQFQTVIPTPSISIPSAQVEEYNPISIDNNLTNPLPEENGQRKQSQQFHNGFWVAQTVQTQPEEVRKESEQFEFQSIQTHPHTETISTVQHEEPLVAMQTVNKHIGHEQEEVNEQVQQVQKQVQQVQQQEQKVQEAGDEDDDEFGDFQETTFVETKAQSTNSPAIAQENTVHINEEYLNSDESQFYKNKEKQLQQFVNSLPDYSFLFAKAFIA